MDLDGATYSTSLQQLPTAHQLHILSFLSPNDRALSGRLVSPDTAVALRGPQHCTAFLSQPLPAHSMKRVMEAGQQHVRQLPFRHKLHLLCTAAASRSEMNLDIALALLQPSVFPELLQRWVYDLGPDVGEAAVRAGHPQLLRWLLRHCPGRLQPEHVLYFAAQHCDLTGLQDITGALKGHHERSSGGSGGVANRPGWPQAILDAAAESATPDGREKMQWLMATSNGCCGLKWYTAMRAVHCGDLGRLRWLHSLGCPMDP